MDLDMVAKPQMKTFAPGTLDTVDSSTKTVAFGVSASVWEGYSGGLCAIMEGPCGGDIIGLGKQNILIPRRRPAPLGTGCLLCVYSSRLRGIR